MKGRKTLFVALFAAFMIVGTAVVAVAHSKSAGNNVIDATNKVSMKAKEGGDVRWILPGPRALDPAVFGTLGNEKGLDLLPVGKRATTPDGYFFSMDGSTPAMTPFSNKWAPIEGEAKVKVKNVTAVSGRSTKDEIDAEFEFTSPDGENEYKLVVKKALPEVDHENFAGVGVNALQHGATGIGTPLMPQLMSLIAFWGAGDLYVNDELQPDKRFVHFMLSQNVRDGDYNLVFNDGVDPGGSWQAHLILPPVALGSDGPFDLAVPTEFLLPNGKDQPFLHIMFEDVQAKG
ncbi:MAG: hypothetical protein BMS9Abin17_0064 [Acidimicrobiia bacterium]|nr:MAG: hypothetical protein BMS9Abin17_0064 [Acidimicrobiia bacterium]